MPKRILQGTVTSDKNDQTITVLVERRFTHPMMKKTVRKSKKYRAHDAENTVQGRRQRPHHRVRADLEDQALDGPGGGSRRRGLIQFCRNRGTGSRRSGVTKHDPDADQSGCR